MSGHACWFLNPCIDGKCQCLCLSCSLSRRVRTCMVVNTGLVHLAHEEFQSDDGIDDDDEEDQQGNMEEWNHGFDYRVQHNL